MVPRQQGVFGRSNFKNKNKLTVTYRGISFLPSRNDTLSSPPYCVGIKIKSVPEEKSNE